MHHANDPLTKLEPHDGAGWCAPVTEDGTTHKDKKVYAKSGEDTPDNPKIINGKKVTHWAQIPGER